MPYKGAVGAVVHQMVGGLRAAMGYTGCATVAEMRTNCRFVRITGAGLTESHVHDVQITARARTTGSDRVLSVRVGRPGLRRPSVAAVWRRV